MIRIKVQRMMEAAVVITQIINDKRAMPQKAKYRLARLHVALKREFDVANAQRNEIIESFDTHEKVPPPDFVDFVSYPMGLPLAMLVDGPRFIVPPDKMPEFEQKWKEIGDSEIEVDIEPVPVRFFDMGEHVDGPLRADEIVALDELLTGE